MRRYVSAAATTLVSQIALCAWITGVCDVLGRSLPPARRDVDVPGADA
jgi:hypothetical protein